MINDGDYIARLINVSGFECIDVTYSDIKKISDMYDLRWTKEDIIMCMTSDKPYNELFRLPIPHKVRFKVIIAFDNMFDKKLENHRRKKDKLYDLSKRIEEGKL